MSQVIISADSRGEDRSPHDLAPPYDTQAAPKTAQPLPREQNDALLEIAKGLSRNPWPVTLTLLVADLTALSAASLIAIYGRWMLGGDYTPTLYLQLWPLLGLFIAAFAVAKLYPALPLSPPEELRRQSLITTVMFLALGTLTFLSKEAPTYSRGVLLAGLLMSLILIPIMRGAARLLFSHKPWWGYPAMILGSGAASRKIIESLLRQPEIGIRPVCVLGDESVDRSSIAGVPVIGRLHRVREYARKYRLPYAVIAMSDVDTKHVDRIIRRFSRFFRRVMIVPPVTEFSSLWVSPVDLGGSLGLESRYRLFDPGRQTLKRLLELLLIALSLPLLLPVLGLICLAIRFDSKGPVIFKHQRLGLGGKHFMTYKFRTMHLDASRMLDEYLAQHPELREEWDRDQKLRNDPRVTRVGRLLRLTSLDELPQLWNVVKGEMSLVGPRPIVDDEVPRYGRDYSIIFRVRPGLTGLWQVSGRNNVDYPERVQMDCLYVRNWSVWLDLYLIARTFRAVLLARGAY